MKSKNKNKTRFKLFQVLSLVGLLLWISESLYFCIRYGWHLHAANSTEKLCDNIVGCIFLAAFFFFTGILYDVAKIFANANITEVNIINDKESTKTEKS
jgi:hypothetical protein